MNVKKIVLFIFIGIFLFFPSFAESITTNISILSGDGYFKITVSGDNIWKKDDTHYYFKDSISYKIETTDRTGTNILGNGKSISGTNDSGTITSTTSKSASASKKFTILWIGGQTESDSKVFYFTKDNTPPVIDLCVDSASVTNGSIINKNQEKVNVNYKDNKDEGSGLKSTVLKVDGVQVTSKDFKVSDNTYEKHTATVTVTDNVNNSLTKSATIIIDRKDPVITVTSSSGDSFVTSSNVKATISDDTSYTAFYSIDKETYDKPYTSDAEIKISDNGSHTVYFKATDATGNIKTASETVYIDKTGPAITFSAPADKWFESVTASAKASDPRGVDEATWSYCLDNGSWTASGSNNNTVTIPEGEHTVKFKVKDKLGNETISDEHTFKVDNKVPEITLTIKDENNSTITDYSTTTNANYHKSVTISAEALDSGSGIKDGTLQYSVDDGAYKTYSSAITLNTTCSSGSKQYHTVVFKVEDNSGKSTFKTAYIYIDATAPTVSFAQNSYQAGNYYNNASVTANASSLSGIESWEVTIDGGKKWKSIETPEIELTSDGSYTIQFKASGKTGLIGFSESKTILIDTTNPTISITGIPSGKVKSGSITIIAADETVKNVSSGIKQIKVKDVVGEQPEDTSESVIANNGVYSFDKEGSHIITITATDNAGNETTRILTPIIIDKTAPTVNVSFNDYLNEITISATSNDEDIDENTWNGSYTYMGGVRVPFTGDSVSLNQDGEVTVIFNVSDTAGNIGSSNPVVVHVDATSPVVTFNDNTDIIENGLHTVILNATVTDKNKDELSNQSGISSITYTITPGDIKNTITFSEDEKIYERSLSIELPESEQTVVKISATDNAGNKTPDTELRQLVDLTPPVITYTGEDIAKKNTEGKYFLRLTEISCTDNLSDISYLKYAIDGKESDAINIALSEIGTISAIDIDTTALPEGRHTIELIAKDARNNIGKSVTREFIVDKTIPLISNVALLNNGIEIEDEAIVIGDEINISVSSVDTYHNSNSEESGCVVGYEYGVSAIENEEPVSWVPCDINTFEISKEKLFDGLNFIYVRVIDEAGNTSECTVRNFTRDTGNPGRPIITSSSHRPATDVIDAEMISFADFEIVPSRATLAGIKGFYYRLYEAASANDDNTAEFVFIEASEKASVHFDYLEDNEENKFYYLEAYCLGGNDVVSEKTTYCFRVDATAPDGFHLSVIPQVMNDNTHQYSQVFANVQWNQPSDMTGVSDYSIEIYINNENVKRIRTTSRSQKIDISSYFGGAEKAGLVTIKAYAFDYAGNTAETERSFYADFDAPSFSYSELVITDSIEVNNGKIIEWGGLTDNQGKCDTITIEYTKIGSDTPPIIIPLPAYDEQNNPLTSYELETLKDKTIYSVKVTGTDLAGNKAKLETIFTVGDITIPDILLVPYEEYFNGFVVSGTKKIEGDETSLVDACLIIPDGISVYKNNISGIEKVTSVEIEDSSDYFSETGPYCYSKNGSKYIVSVDGFNFEGNSLSFSDETGLTINDVVYTLPLKDVESKNITFASVLIGFPNMMSIESSSYTLNNNTIETACFDIKGINSLKIGNQGIILNENKQGASFVSDSLQLKNKDGTNSIPLSDVYIDSDYSNPEAKISDSIFLNLEDTEYKIINSGIDGNLLKVYEAEVDLPAGYNPQKLIIRNFTINQSTLEVTKGRDFETGYYEIKDNENVFVRSRVSITDGNNALLSEGVVSIDNLGRLIIAGNYNAGSAYPLLSVSDLQLTNEGINLIEGGNIQSIDTSLFGFNTTIIKAKITDKGLLVTEGKITIYGNDFIFHNLGIDPSGSDKIYQECTIVGEFNKDTSASYGANTHIKNMCIKGDGIYADASIQIYGSEKPWVLNNTKLFSSGIISVYSETPHKTVIGGYELTSKKVSFNGENVNIEEAEITPIDGFNADKILINDMILTAEEVKNGGKVSSSYTYLFDGWEVDFRTLALTCYGIEGAVNVSSEIDENGNSWNLVFMNAILTSDGDLISGTISSEETESSLMSNNYSIILGNASFEKVDGKYVIVSNAPYIPLSDAEKKIKLGKAILTSDASFISEISEQEVNFKSLNGYTVTSTGAWYDGDKVLIKGNLLHDTLLKLPCEINQIQMNPDFTIEVETAVSQITLFYSDWEITATDVVFGKYEITSASNTIEYKNTTFELGELEFSVEGILLGDNIRSQHENVQIISPTSRLFETRFTENGLYASVQVVLPDAFNGEKLTFSSVKLYPNGKYFANTIITHKKIDLGAVNFEFNYLALTENGLRISEAAINVPALENLTISLDDLVISNAGDIELRGGCTSPFKLWNMVFCLQNLDMDSEGIGIKGYVTLPSSLPGVLSGRTIGLRELQIGYDGNVKQLDARFEGNFVIPFLDKWSLELDSIGLGYSECGPEILLQSAQLIVPEGLGLTKLSIGNVSFNPVNGEFDFEKIQADFDLQTTISGIQFSFNKLSMTKDLTFSFGGSAKFVGEEMPEFIKGKEIVIETFEITKDGTIGSIDVALDGLDGKIAPNIEALILKEGSVRVEKESGNDLYLSVSGALQFTDKAPAFLGDIDKTNGVAFRLENFKINTSKPEITELKAYLSKKQGNAWSKDPKIINFDPVFSGNQLNDVFISFEYDGEKKTGDIVLAGGLILPDTLPEGVAGSEVRLEQFVIGLDGKVKSFAGDFSIQKTNIGAIELQNVNVGAELENDTIEYDLGATVVLPKDKFPEGIGGLSTTARFVFTSSQLKSVNAQIDVPSAKLVNTLDLEGATLSLVKNQNTALLISITGSVKLPSSFPQGLAGMRVGIQKLTINESGEFQDVDIGVSDVSVCLFNALQLSGGGVNFQKASKDEFLINIVGSLAFVGNGIPADLKNTSFGIEKLTLSTKTGLKEFSAGMNGGLSCKVLGGVDLSISKLWFTDTGFTAKASAGLSFSGVNFGNTRFDAEMSMNWNGKITAFTGGLGALDVTIAGFKGSISELYVDTESGSSDFKVMLKECRLTLPANLGSMGGESVALKNAVFNPNTGDFTGEFEIPTIKTEIVGFTLLMTNPSIDFKYKKIGFTQVSLDLPEFLGSANVALNNVTINSSKGLEIGGGAFRLPDFKIGELGFKNISAEFILDGSDYMISGTGGVMIPGVGEISTILSFTNKSPMYPIGLKRAFFSYEASFGGIPLGTTGLYLNGIRGGLAYGPPEDVPEVYRGLFGENGTRLQLGLTVKDQSGGKLVRMGADTWIDVTKFAMAFQGDATLLSGTLDISANAYAAFTNNVFATGMKVQILFVRGEMEVYIFDKNGSLKFSGRAEASIGMPKAYLLDSKVLKVPSNDIWLGGFGVMFGDFTNDKRGFLAYIDINIGDFNLGRVGAFVGSGGLDIKVKNYDILRPDGINFRSARSGAARSIDLQYRATGLSQIYTVNIPSNSGEFISSITGSARAVSDGIAQSEQEKLDRVIYALGYLEGTPDFTVISPSGKEYHAGDPSVETEYIENGMIISVASPEIGNWTLIVDNMEEGTYEIAALGVERIPEVILEEPSSGVLAVQDSIYVSGTTTEVNGKVAIFAAEDETKPDMELTILNADETGHFEGYVSTDVLNEGTYIIVAKGITHDGLYSVPSYSSGKYLIDRSRLTMEKPENFRLSEIADGSIKLSWENSNGARTKGYFLKKINMLDGTEDIENVGNIYEITSRGYENGSELTYAVASYDEYDNVSDYTESLSIKIGGDKTEYNIPVISENQITVQVIRGEHANGYVNISYDNWNETDSYIILGNVTEDIEDRKILTEEEFEALSLEKESVPIDISFEKDIRMIKDGNTVTYSVYVDDSCVPGTYKVNCVAYNEDNYQSKAMFTVNVVVINPTPEITKIVPASINGTMENQLVIYGSGFVNGSQYFIDDTELSVVDMGSNNVTTKTLLIPEFKDRGTKSIKVRNPDGVEASIPIEVTIPGYDLVLYTEKVLVEPGDDALFYIKAEPFDGYNGTVPLKIKEIPDDFNVSIPLINLEELACISISSSKYINDGEYLFTFESGEIEFTLKTVIESEAILPTITAINPSRVIAGNEVTIVGYGFANEETIVKVNGIRAEVLQSGRQEINFVVPKDIEDGIASVTVHKGSLISNTGSIEVHKEGYSVLTGKDEVEVYAGESKNISIALNGYANDISLKLNYDPDVPFKAQISTDKVNTNAIVTLTVTAEQMAKSGTYELLIATECGRYRVEKVITVHVKNEFEIITEKIPGGTTGVAYEMLLETSDSERETSWTVTSGRLPGGVYLSKNGKIQGVPTDSGNYTFEVTASTLNGTKAISQYTLRIEEDMWSQNGKNPGRANNYAGDIPTTDQIQWNIEVTDSSESLYVAGNEIVSITKDNVKVYSRNTGRLQWSTGYGYKQSFVADNQLYGLTYKGVLEVRTLYTGLLSWQRENIEQIASDGNVILVKESGQYSVIDAATGDKTIYSLHAGFEKAENIIWYNGNAYEWNGSVIKGIYGSNKSWNAETEIRAAACDTYGFIIVTEKYIHVLDSNMSCLNSNTFISEGNVQLAIDENEIAIQTNDITIVYNRETLNVEWVTRGGTIVAMANEKVVIADSKHISVLNRYNGKEIWGCDGEYSSIALYEQKLFTAQRSSITAYNGVLNATAPETVISFSIPEPDGNNGWYKTLPEITVSSEDRETYVENLKVNFNNKGYKEYEGSWMAVEGLNNIEAYGTDNKGYRGVTEIAQIMTDITKPVSTMITNCMQNEFGWYDQNVYVQIEASDNGSGIAYIMENDEKYQGGKEYINEGVYNLKWFSVDNAGNIEEEQNTVIRVDKYLPITSSSVKQDKGITVVELDASDTGSGIDRIEYAIDGESYGNYENPIVLLETGWHVITWDAVDVSGKHSGVQMIRINVQKDNSFGKVLGLAELNGNSVDIERLDYSSAMYTWNVSGDKYRDGIPSKYWNDIYDSFWGRNSFNTLPSYVLNSEYLKYKATDLMIEGKREIFFYVKQNAVLYMFAAPTMEVDESWTRIEQNAAIQSGWYRDGWNVYMRRAEQAEKITIYAGDRTVALPVIAAKPDINVSAEIVLERNDAWDDIYYHGRKPYREGVLIHIDAKVSIVDIETNAPVTKKWTIVSDGKESELTTLWYTLPKVTEDTELTFRYEIISSDGITECVAEKTIVVCPPDNPEDVFPWY